jgi:insertion element IS1 protein InsB
MVTQVLHCSHCHGTDIVRHGTTRQGKQRYRGRACPERGRTFLLDYAYAGQSPEIKRQIVDMAMNASGIRDTARVWRVSPTTVIKELKNKEADLQQVNPAVLQQVPPEHVEVELWRADELAQRRGLTSELDEMWSYVGQKAEPRWVWHAIDHRSGTVLAYVFGRRKDPVFLPLTALLEPLGITRVYTEGWGAYERHIDPEQHVVGKQHTQKIESKHINLRTRMKRLVRRTICFSKTTTMHDLVIGLFVNRYEFGLAL